MKETPQEKILLDNFKPGKISKDGFLGTDNRHVHDIIREDLLTLSRSGITPEIIAERLQYFIDKGTEGLESRIEIDGYHVIVFWIRGQIPCPFGDPGVHRKLVATIFDASSEMQIKYSQLSVHMIKEHGFFGGKGSPYRLEPSELIALFKFKLNQS